MQGWYWKAVVVIGLVVVMVAGGVVVAVGGCGRCGCQRICEEGRLNLLDSLFSGTSYLRSRT